MGTVGIVLGHTLGWVTHKQQQGNRSNQNLRCMAVITGYYANLTTSIQLIHGQGTKVLFAATRLHYTAPNRHG